MLFPKKRDTNSLGGTHRKTTKRKLSPIMILLLATVLSVISLSMNDGNHNHNTGATIGGGFIGVDALPIVTGTRKLRNGKSKSNRKHLTVMRTSSSDQSAETVTSKTKTTTPIIEWIPTRIEFEGVYRSYGQPGLWRKLTSSVPRREFALQDLTLAFGNIDPTKNSNNDGIENGNESERDGSVRNTEDSLCLLLGASSSGKSTIFRSILEAAAEEKYEKASSNSKEFGSAGNQGTLEIRQLPLPKQTLKSKTPTTTTTTTPKPILLDDRGEVNEAHSGQPKKTLGEAWVDCFRETTETISDCSNDETNDVAAFLVETLAATIFDLDPNALLADLTPSEKYRFCLGKACIQSSSFGCASSSDNIDSILLPGPILLLDEWMDVETSAVVRKVQPSLHKIVEELNGIVLSITHKPELYYSSGAAATASPGEQHSTSTIRKITLTAGKLLSDY